MSPIPASVVMRAIEHVKSPIIIFRQDMRLFAIMLANALSQFGVDIHPEDAWLALADANIEYATIKESAMERHPEKVIENMCEVCFIETPLEKVYTPEYLRELDRRGWLPTYMKGVSNAPNPET